MCVIVSFFFLAKRMVDISASVKFVGEFDTKLLRSSKMCVYVEMMGWDIIHKFRIESELSTFV